MATLGPNVLKSSGAKITSLNFKILAAQLYCNAVVYIHVKSVHLEVCVCLEAEVDSYELHCASDGSRFLQIL